MRYIIEQAVLLAEILDRELILPSFTFASGCEVEKLASLFYESREEADHQIRSRESDRSPDCF